MGRLLLINHVAELGGSEYGLLDVARYYGPDRCHVVLFSDGPLRERLQSAGIGVTVLKAGGSMMGVTRDAGKLRAVAALPGIAAMGWQLARIARDYDVLYANSQKAALVTMLIGPLIGRPVIWHLHDILSAEHFAQLQRQAIVFLANRSARRVIAISKVSEQSFVDSGGKPELVDVVLNGIDISRFANIDELNVTALRRSMGLEGKRLIGLFGRITPWKGQHILIEALASVPDAEALLVGDSLFGESDYKAQLHEQAKRLGIEDRIHWLGYRNDTPQLMRMVDVVVHTSTAPEPFGRVILEGVLAGRPVLASSHGASRELLGDDYRWLVPPDDAPALARAIREILSEPDESVATIIAAERDRVARLFSLPQMMRGIEQSVGLAA